jgi:hypothetical protein
MTGDGSMALTIQEIGTMIKAKCKVIVFVINNDGYTVERLIWGAQQRKFLSSALLCSPPPTPTSSHFSSLYLSKLNLRTSTK